MRSAPALKVFLSLVLAVSAARAQNLEDIPRPVPPLVATVPENADWTVTLKDPAASDGGPDKSSRFGKQITMVQSTKTGRFKRDRITTADGTTEERWFVDMLLLWPDAGGEVAVTDLSDVPFDVNDANPSVPRGFPGVAWLKPEYFDKAVLIEKRPYYHYVHEGQEAWIDVETRLPHSYKNGNAVFQFKFNPKPTGPLALPAAYQKSLDICEKAMAYRKKLLKDLSGGR